MTLFRLSLVIILLSSCTIPVKYRPFIDTEKVNEYCTFGIEYESPLYTDRKEDNTDVLNLILNSDSTYLINISYDHDQSIPEFRGEYHVTRRGLVTLQGEHPFKKPTIQIWENRTFQYHLNEEYQKIYKKKQYAYCEYGGIDYDICRK